STLGLPNGTPPPRLKPCRRWQCASLSSKRTNGSVRTSTGRYDPSGCCTRRTGSKLAVLATWKKKPYSSHSAATLRVKLLRLLAHQKPEPSFLSNGITCRGSALAASACTARLRSRTLNTSVPSSRKYPCPLLR